jgi:hypothetical protein
MSSQKVSVGPKTLTVYDPSWLVFLFGNHLYQPVTSPMKIDREGVVFYKLQVKDMNTNKILDVHFVLPEELSSTVYLITPDYKGKNEMEAVWDTVSDSAVAYKDAVNQALDYWLKQIQTANTFDKTPEIGLLPPCSNLKWPWKNHSNEEYFRDFNPTFQLHKFNLGIGYYNQEKNFCGVSLQLSLYSGKTGAAIEAEKVSKKRRRIQREEPTGEGELTTTSTEEVSPAVTNVV